MKNKKSAGMEREVGKRLVLCLDGTWNKRDSNTNVFHLHNFVADRDGAQRQQLRYYDAGVGTSKIDYLTGGGFGFGLDENVIEAYEWLIENYDKDDEIYIFGFSRGAYTARSLCGLIMKCGLLWPGAPLTVEQLWQGYRVLGIYRDLDRGGIRPPSFLESIFGREQRQFRPITELKYDSGHVYGENLNPTEQLLVDWSRRIKITCLGVFDTVGAMGWDALGIPGLRTRIAAFHNTNPSTIVQHGFQALAVDEHRRSFRHVPWERYTPKPEPGEPEPVKKPWSNFEQRWFTGAHANVGGGYENNPLCLFPLAWIMQSAGKLGLAYRDEIPAPKAADCVPLRPEDVKWTPLRDSYDEFLRGFAKIIQSPYLRTIAPPEVDRGDHTIESINEVVDESVFEFCRQDKTYRPQNVMEYCARRNIPFPPPAPAPDAPASPAMPAAPTTVATTL